VRCKSKTQLFEIGGRRKKGRAAEERANRLEGILYEHSAKTLLDLGIAAGADGAIDSAINVLGRSLNADNVTPWDKASAWYFLGVNYSAKDCLQVAISCYGSSIRAAPAYATAVPAWNNRGVLLGRRGRLEEARCSLLQAVSLAPKFDIGWSNLGSCYDEMEDYDRALMCFQEALKYGDEAMTWNNQGCALHHLGRLCEAIESFDRALHRDPDLRIAWLSRGNALNDMREYEDAVLSFDNAISLGPHIGSTWRDRATALKGMGAPWEALASVERAIDLGDVRMDCWITKGDILQSMGKEALAIQAYDSATSHGSVDPLVWNSKAICQQHLGRFVEAESSMDSAIALDPSSGFLWANRAAMEHLRGNNRYANICYQLALVFGYDKTEVRFGYGVTQLALGDMEGSAVTFRGILPESRGDAAAYEVYSAALMLSGRGCEVLEMADAVLTLSPGYDSALRIRDAALTMIAIEDTMGFVVDSDTLKLLEINLGPDWKFVLGFTVEHDSVGGGDTLLIGCDEMHI
jgi:tetratricopeptide (TPR) repeat protein